MSACLWFRPEKGGYLTRAFLAIFGLLQYVFKSVLTYFLTCYIASVWYMIQYASSCL